MYLSNASEYLRLSHHIPFNIIRSVLTQKTVFNPFVSIVTWSWPRILTHKFLIVKPARTCLAPIHTDTSSCAMCAIISQTTVGLCDVISEHILERNRLNVKFVTMNVEQVGQWTDMSIYVILAYTKSNNSLGHTFVLFCALLWFGDNKYLTNIKKLALQFRTPYSLYLQH